MPFVKKQKAARNFEQLSDVIHTISINSIQFELELNYVAIILKYPLIKY
jgi:hypothetical protein